VLGRLGKQVRVKRAIKADENDLVAVARQTALEHPEAYTLSHEAELAHLDPDHPFLVLQYV
jgi:hypothetical protein